MLILLEDQFHAEWIGEFATWREAFAELLRLEELAWDQPPNRCPCMSWENCHRQYELIGYDSAMTPWKELERLGGLAVSAKGPKWYGELAGAVLPENYG